MPTTPSTAKNRARGFVLGLALCGACLPAVAAPAAGPGADFFTNGPLHRFEIQLDGESLEGLRATPRKYRPATVRADGQTYTGMVKNNSVDGLVLMDLAGQEKTLPQTQIVANTVMPTSLMPMGLEQSLSEQQLLDLVAWLASLK